MLDRRVMLAAWLVLGGCAASAFAITGTFEGEPPRETPSRSESALGNPNGYVGYDPIPAQLSSTLVTPVESAAAQTSAAEQAADGAATRAAIMAAANPVPSADPSVTLGEAVERVSRLGRAARDLGHILLTDGEPPSADFTPHDFVSHEDGHSPEPRPQRDRYDYYDRQMSLVGSWYVDELRDRRWSEPRFLESDMSRRSRIQTSLPLEGGRVGSRNLRWPFPAEAGKPRVEERDTLTAPLLFGERQPGAPVPGAARLKAIRAAFRADGERFAKFWKREEGLLIKAAGDYFPLTFSLDSELSVADAFRMIVAHDESKKRLDGAAPMVYTPEELSSALGLSVKQLKHFALRQGVEKGDLGYILSDLRPDYFALAAKELTTRIRGGELKSLAGEAAAALGLPVVATLDSLDKMAPPLVANQESYDLELSHRSWEEIPWLFAALIRRLHQALVAPQTHLHIGLPSADGKDANVAVARAMETLMVLDLAAAPPSSLRKQGFGATVLTKDVYSRREDARGLVNFRFKEWQAPHETDNLELRYYPDIETGLRWLALAAELARRHKSLRVYPEFGLKEKSLEASDNLTVNLAGALKYASLLLSESSEAEDRLVGADLRLFSHQVEDFWARTSLNYESLPMELRERIADYLRSRHVRERMPASVFLKPGVSRPTSPTKP